MTVREIMTADPACCAPETALREVARMMVENDCGAIPVCKSDDSKEVIGIVTDRDIVCRAVAKGRNPLELTARDCMSSPVTTVAPDASLEECCRKMEENRVRRIPVLEAGAACCGMVAQADIANNGPEQETARLVKGVSQPSPAVSGRV